MRRAETPDRRQSYDSSQHFQLLIRVSFETSEQNPTSAERTGQNSGARVTYWSPSGSQKSFSTGTDPASFLISPPTSLGSESNPQYSSQHETESLGEQSNCSRMNYGRAHQKKSRGGKLALHNRKRRHSRSQNDGWDRIGNEGCRCKTDAQDKRSENTENSTGCRCNTDMTRSNAESACKRPSHRKHYPWNDSDRFVQSNTPSQEDNSMTREHNQTVRDYCQPQRTKASCSCGNQGQRIDQPPKSGEGCVVGRQMVEPCQCGGRCSRRNSWCDLYNTSTDASFPMTDRSQNSSYSYCFDSGTFQQNVGGNKSEFREKCDGNFKCPSCSENYPQGSQRRPREQSRDTSVSENQSCSCSNTERNKRYSTLYPRQSQDKNNENSQATPQRKSYN